MTVGEKIQEILKGIKVIDNKEFNLMTISKEIWDSDYQGEPTIPLSAIEKIHTEVGDLEWYGDEAFWDGVNAVTDIIDKAIKECDTDE